MSLPEPIRPWQQLLGHESAGHILVAGNGPSLGEPVALDPMRQALAAGAKLIACNAYWRWFSAPTPDYLVCFDQPRALEALSHTDLSPILVPWRGINHDMNLPTQAWERHPERLLAIHPYSSAYWTSKRGSGPFTASWHPSTEAVGNLSGILAFQLAIILGAAEISLIGMDVGGKESPTGTVRLSACRPDWPGYEHQEVQETHCEAIGECLVPRGRLGTLDIWRRLTQWTLERGIRVNRLVDAGAMTWLPVRAPGAEPDPHARIPLQH